MACGIPNDTMGSKTALEHKSVPETNGTGAGWGAGTGAGTGLGTGTGAGWGAGTGAGTGRGTGAGTGGGGAGVTAVVALDTSPPLAVMAVEVRKHWHVESYPVCPPSV